MTEASPSELPPVVLDASVGIAVVRDEPAAAGIRASIAGWARLDREMLVPSLFWIEVLNPLARKHRYSSEEMLRAVDALEDLAITTIDPDRTLLLLTVDHIERYGLTAYDAHYLALAHQLGADLATLDVDLLRAAGPSGVLPDGGHRLHDTPVPYEHDVTWPNYKEASAYLAKLRAEALASR